MIGIEAIEQGNLVTFGVEPSQAETGYGYLELEKNQNHSFGRVVRFIEKPDFNAASEMLKAGNYFWNAGIFMFRARDLITAFEKYQKTMLVSVNNAVESVTPDLDFLRLDIQFWDEVENISIDYAIMEKVDNIVAVPFSAAGQI